MIRLTATLSALIFVGMVIWGQDVPGTVSAPSTDGVARVPVVSETAESPPEDVAIVRVREPAPPRSTTDDLNEGIALVPEVIDLTPEVINTETTVQPEEAAQTDTADVPPFFLSPVFGLRATEIPAGVTVTETDAPPAEIWYVTGTRVNVRAGPSTGNAVISQLGRGEAAEVLEFRSDGWVHIRFGAEARDGYMSANFLSRIDPGQG